MSLTSIPRVTGVSSEEEAFNRLRARHYDMVIIMIGVDKESPLDMWQENKIQISLSSYLLLLNNPSDMAFVRSRKQ